MSQESQPGPMITENGEFLLASTARTALTGVGESKVFPGSIAGLALTLDVTAAASTGDTLDVYVQTKIDRDNWLDVCRFVQVSGASTGERHHDKIHANGAFAADASSALSAGVQRDLLGNPWRARWVMTDNATSGNISFTFSVFGQPM